jgi:hypothetical protein
MQHRAEPETPTWVTSPVEVVLNFLVTYGDLSLSLSHYSCGLFESSCSITMWFGAKMAKKKQLSSIVDVFINYVKFSMNKKNYLNFNVNVLES